MTAGQRIVLHVSGARGSADVWELRVAGIESVSVGALAVDAVRLLREPQRAYDTRVEVWLDPARQWLPVRVRWANRDDGSDALELTRID